MKKSKIFYGWWIVALVFMISAYGGATIWYGFTAFFNPLIDEFAWSYTAISVAASIRGVEFGVLDIFTGFIADRFSIRGMILVGSVFVGIGWLILSQVNSLGIFYTSFIIICAGASGIGGVVLSTLLTRWFQKRLGLVIGLLAAGSGIGGLSVPGIVSLLDIVGFRSVFLIFGIFALIIGGIAAYFIRNYPDDMGSVPDGTSPNPEENVSLNIPEQNKAVIPEDPISNSDYPFKKAISKPAFWIITYAGIAALFSWVAIVTHIMPYLEHLGYSRNDASFVAMLLPLISIGGRLFTGWISDKFSFRTIYILAFSGQLIGIIFCYYANFLFALVLFVILIATTYGSVTVLRTLALRRCYGTTNIGTILGLTTSIGQFGSIAGPIFAGWIFDVRGSYDLVWIAAAIFILSSIPLLAVLKKPY